jgi:hypothetical protein
MMPILTLAFLDVISARLVYDGSRGSVTSRFETEPADRMNVLPKH